ncbi:MAG TPA: cysteine desulfurase [Firmicutes bacterium]|nr:cysteine desulfurase [Bacillota bacterium]
MIDVNKIREDFPMFKNYKTAEGKPIVYLDNAATTFKPYSVISAIEDYYMKETANAHRGDYELAHNVDVHYESARETVKRFINAERKEEICFTSGTSMSINVIAYGLEHLLNSGDEIILSEAEHASNVLPWFGVAKKKGCIIKYAPIDEKLGIVTPKGLESVISKKTKVVSLAQVTNVLGGMNDSKALAKVCHAYNALFVLDGAQSVPHVKVDVLDLDCDFLAFSAHKMCGPTGIGVLYGKYELLDQMPPLLSGGGMNTRFETCGNILLQRPPLKFEAGTQNIAGAYGLKAAIEYLEKIGMNNIEEYENMLHERLISGLKKLDNVVIYNPYSTTGIVTFNIKDVFAQDAATYFSSKGIAVRSGQHCAKILMDYLKTSATVRASTYFYNTIEDIDKLIECAKDGGNFLDAYFS